MNKLKYLVPVLFALVVLLVSCAPVGAPGPTHEAVSPQSVSVVHNGDMWYIPVNRPGLPEANIEIIFQVISDWQIQHPDLEIVDVDYLYMQNTYSLSTSNYTYGVTLLTAPVK